MSRVSALPPPVLHYAILLATFEHASLFRFLADIRGAHERRPYERVLGQQNILFFRPFQQKNVTLIGLVSYKDKLCEQNAANQGVACRTD
jgi:hypothetical protein